MAHALHGYHGACGNIHGHSYELHVTLATPGEDYLPSPGFIVDYKTLKQSVLEEIIESFDHRLLLSEAFIAANPGMKGEESLVVTSFEPSSENLLLFIQRALSKKVPPGSRLDRLRLYETTGSYAEWEDREFFFEQRLSETD